jgi:hypothetical protein
MSVTVAPDMTPPLWSITVPRIRPLLPCENNDTENSNTPRTAESRKAILLLRPEKDVRNPDGIELIVSPLRRFYIGLGPQKPDRKQLMRLRLLRRGSKVKK